MNTDINRHTHTHTQNIHTQRNTLMCTPYIHTYKHTYNTKIYKHIKHITHVEMHWYRHMTYIYCQALYCWLYVQMFANWIKSELIHLNSCPNSAGRFLLFALILIRFSKKSERLTNTKNSVWQCRASSLRRQVQLGVNWNFSFFSGLHLIYSAPKISVWINNYLRWLFQFFFPEKWYMPAPLFKTHYSHHWGDFVFIFFFTPGFRRHRCMDNPRVPAEETRLF